MFFHNDSMKRKGGEEEEFLKGCALHCTALHCTVLYFSVLYLLSVQYSQFQKVPQPI